jgi:hypothetical protein
MMSLGLFLCCLVVLAVDSSVMGEMVRTRTFTVFTGKRVAVNGSTSLDKARSGVASIIDCGSACLDDDDCVAANFEDGTCHMWSAGLISMEDSNNTTAILAPFEGKVTHIRGVPSVGGGGQ